MPGWFRRNGYTTVSVGKVSHHPGGRGGKDWNDDATPEMPDAWDRHLMPVKEWQHPRGAMHGLAHGEIRVKANDMAVFQATEGPDTIYPDGLITEEAIKQLYDHASAEKETRNVAEENPDIVQALKERLEARLQRIRGSELR